MKALIADDSLISRRLLEAALRKWDYEVVMASDGEEAWEQLRWQDAPRIAILDWMMPGLSGPEVCRRVRELKSDRYTYILLVTSRSHREDLIEGMEAGADDYITKPFDQNELKVRLGSGRRIVELQDLLLSAQDALREQATKDALTQLWNRRTILEIFDRELVRAIRQHTPLSLAMADIDGFKAINDSYGHQAGDRILQETCSRIRASCRKYDSVGRYGGEEFLVVLPGCTGPDAEAQAERLRAGIEDPPFCFPGGELTVTCSFGVTTLPEGSSTGADALIKAADDALYAAKQQGRNRVVQCNAATVLDCPP